MRLRSLLLLAVFILCCSAVASAGKRDYVWSYDYGIGPRGGTEFEGWWTAKTQDSSRSEETTHELRLEIEVPITDRWETDFYLVFDQEPDESLDFSNVFWSNK